MTIVPRPYQQAAIDSVLKSYESDNTSGIVCMSTGGGKSVVIAAIAKEIQEPLLVLQPSKEILEQNHGKMIAYGYGKDVGIFSASCGSKDINRITLATIGTVTNNIESFSHFKHVMIDECHLVNPKPVDTIQEKGEDGFLHDKQVYGMYKDLITYLENARLVGLTATPFRMHTNSLGTQARIITRTRPRIFKDFLHVTDVVDLYELGYMSPYSYDEVPVDTSMLRINSTGAEYTTESIASFSKENDVYYKVLRKVIENKDRKRILIFCLSVNDAHNMAEMLTNKGIPTRALDANTPKKVREQILWEFKQGKIRAIANVGVLTTGYDLPALDCIIDSGKTLSLSRYIQKIGRGSRICEGKTDCLYIDICEHVKHFGTYESMRLVKDEKGSDAWESNMGILTGVNLADIGNPLATKTLEKALLDNPEIKDIKFFTFGKFKGIPLKKVPRWYLKWGTENFVGKWKAVCERELIKYV